MKSIIEISQLTRNYGNGYGIFDLNFTVKEGEVFGFLGPNGAGKTTTIRHLMGFIRSQKGYCKIFDKDCWNDREYIQESLGYIPGEISLPNDMTGIDFLNFYSEYRGMKNKEKMNKLIDFFEFNPKAKIKKMSKGMKQKVGIISAFMHDPDVLILDEPTSGLDPLMQNKFIELIIEERKKGKTILMSSHMFEEVERTCERVGIIRNGKMITTDSVDKLKSEQVRKYIITFSSKEEAEKFSHVDLNILNVDGTKATVLIKNNIKNMIEAMNRFDVTNISAPNQSLEEIFLDYYGGSKHD